MTKIGHIDLKFNQDSGYPLRDFAKYWNARQS